MKRDGNIGKMKLTYLIEAVHCNQIWSFMK